MLSDTMLAALNKQINHEFHAAYAYLGMAGFCDAENYDGFAKWMRLQAEEEIEHGMKIYEHIQERGGVVELMPIDKPTAKFDSIRIMFEQALKLEQNNTAAINKLYEQAIDEKDHPVKVLLHWFIEEQVEEENNLESLLAKINMAKEHPSTILMLDRYMGRRGEGS